MKILKYLTWFGEDALKPDTVLYSFASGIQRVIDEIENKISCLTKQIYLATAEGEWLDLWGWDLAALRRLPFEADSDYRTRIFLALFHPRNIRKSIKRAVEIISKNPPVEIFEPIRDSAYWDKGYFYIPEHNIGAAAANDGNGAYCARPGTLRDTSYTGYVKVKLAADYRGGAGLAYYDSLNTYDSRASLSPICNVKKGMPETMVVEAIHAVQSAGTQVFVEFI